MRRSNSILVVVALVVAALLTLTVALTAGAAGGASVDVTSNEFTPNTITVTVGTDVTWTRLGGFHNVRSDTDVFSNTASSTWTTFTHNFDTAGTYEYYCEIHSDPNGTPGQDMNGIVNVIAPTAVTLDTMATTRSSMPLWGLGAGVLGLGALAGYALRRRKAA